MLTNHTRQRLATAALVLTALPPVMWAAQNTDTALGQEPPAPPAAGGGIPPTTSTQLQTGAGLADPCRTHVFVQRHGPRAGRRYIVRAGARWYESRRGARDWGKGGIIARNDGAYADGGNSLVGHVTPGRKGLPTPR